MHWVEKLILTVSPENVAKHFRNFLELYVKPFKVYKKAISIRRNSLNYTILNVYYYGIFFFFIVGSALTVLKAIGLELILTLIPFLIFIIPFLVVKKIVTLKIKSNRLFRLLLLVKIQLVPIFIILLLSARTIDNRLLYIAIENLIYVIWIAWMIIPPIVIAKLAKHKLFWILTNYLFFLLFILIFSFLAESFSD